MVTQLMRNICTEFPYEYQEWSSSLSAEIQLNSSWRTKPYDVEESICPSLSFCVSSVYIWTQYSRWGLFLFYFVYHCICLFR